MADRKEIEGTKERAADRGQPFGLEFFEKAPDGLPLGDPEVVRNLVVGFAGEVNTLVEEAAAGQDRAAAFTALCARYADLFTGKSDGYALMPFNSEAGLGEFLVARYQMDCGPDDAAFNFFGYVGGQVREAAFGVLTGELEPDAAKFRIAVTIDEAVGSLLGLPADEE